MTVATLPITSNKVRDLTPRWARYCGFSILWDNPPEEERELYRALGDVVTGWDLAALADRFMFCPLPPSTYHVTLCDGINQGVARDLPWRHARAALAYAKGMPYTLLAPPECAFPYFDTPLLEVAAAHPVTLVAAAVEVRGHALVAALAPASAADEEALGEVQAARADLVDAMARDFGVETQDLHPHVTLGYLANRDLAAEAAPHLAGPLPSLPPLRLGEAAVYGFTDMVSFWRHPGRSPHPTPGAS